MCLIGIFWKKSYGPPGNEGAEAMPPSGCDPIPVSSTIFVIVSTAVAKYVKPAEPFFLLSST